MRTWILLIGLLSSTLLQAAPGVDAFTVAPDGEGGQTYTLTIQVLLFMTALTLLPGALMMMTSFARIIIVLAILRQALGTQNTPSNQILIGLALFLTLFIMMPVFTEVNEVALQPYLAEELDTVQALQAAAEPVKSFMMAQTREDDLSLFARIGDFGDLEEADDVPFSLLLPS
ncbi:MAG: flagellar biosynthetic protein FliP, partial [Candidatus Thiodiazotropha sp.]